MIGEDVENGVGGGFGKVPECLVEFVRVIHPIHIVRSGGYVEGWRWNRPHDICGFDPWDKEVMSVNRYGRLCIAEGDQQEGTRDLTSGQVVEIGFLRQPS